MDRAEKEKEQAKKRKQRQRERERNNGITEKNFKIDMYTGIFSSVVGSKLPRMTHEELKEKLTKDFFGSLSIQDLDYVYNELYEYSKRIKKNLVKAIADIKN